MKHRQVQYLRNDLAKLLCVALFVAAINIWGAKAFNDTLLYSFDIFTFFIVGILFKSLGLLKW